MNHNEMSTEDLVVAARAEEAGERRTQEYAVDNRRPADFALADLLRAVAGRLEAQAKTEAESLAAIKREWVKIAAVMDKLRGLTDEQMLLIAKRVFSYLVTLNEPPTLTDAGKNCGEFVIPRIVEAIESVVGPAELGY